MPAPSFHHPLHIFHSYVAFTFSTNIYGTAPTSVFSRSLRNLVNWWFDKLKSFIAIATRVDKRGDHFLAFRPAFPDQDMVPT